MALINITPSTTDRALFIGSTGCGKTYLMVELSGEFYGVKQIQILNTKSDTGINTIDAPNVDRLEDVARYKFPEYPLVIYTPCGEELADEEILDNWCQWIYDRKNTHAVIDELTQLGSGVHPKKGLLNLATRGRDRNISVFYGTQRPLGIPKIVYTESQHIYKFHLADEDDRKAVKKYTHPLMVNQAQDEHGFHYFKTGTRKVIYIKSI